MVAFFSNSLAILITLARLLSQVQPVARNHPSGTEARHHHRGYYDAAQQEAVRPDGLEKLVDCDPDKQLIRNIQRNTIDRGGTVSMVVDRYLEVLKPMHEQFIEPTKRYVDLIIPQGGENIKVIGILCKYIEDLVPME